MQFLPLCSGHLLKCADLQEAVPVPDFSLALEDRPNESIGVAGTR